MTALSSTTLGEIDRYIEKVMCAARIPGAALCVVDESQELTVRSYGIADMATARRMTPQTPYAIASTTKSMNAYILGRLVHDGFMDWDTPVTSALPDFRLMGTEKDISVLDLVTMRTGLPRHDWVWLENAVTRPELVSRVSNLELSAPPLKKWQYNNLTVTLAGHVAEVSTGEPWEHLIERDIFAPLQMSTARSCFEHNGMVGYHENTQRELIPSFPFLSDVTAPSGGLVHATVQDMGKWLAFNIKGAIGQASEADNDVLRELHRPRIFAGHDPSAPSAGASYATGWFIDSYHDRTRLSHSGLLHGINSDLCFFPSARLGIVSTINFGSAALARTINEDIFSILNGDEPSDSYIYKIRSYDDKVRTVQTQKNNARAGSIFSPPRPLSAYFGKYRNRGYGDLEIAAPQGTLVLFRGRLRIPLHHVGSDAWLCEDSDMFPIFAPHPFDENTPLIFHGGNNSAPIEIHWKLEPTVGAVCFERVGSLPLWRSDGFQ